MNESCVYTLLGFGATRTATARVNRFTTLWICLHYAEARYEVRVERIGKQPLVARFGGIPRVRERRAVIIDRTPDHEVTYQRKELVRRLLARRCELCGEPGKVIVHQVRNLASLEKHIGQFAWAALMARKRRKTLVVCHPCHDVIHDGFTAAAHTA